MDLTHVRAEPQTPYGSNMGPRGSKLLNQQTDTILFVTGLRTGFVFERTVFGKLFPLDSDLFIPQTTLAFEGFLFGF